MAMDAAVPQIGLWRATSAAYNKTSLLDSTINDNDDGNGSVSSCSEGSQITYSSFADLRSQWEERSACSSKDQSQKGQSDGENGLVRRRHEMYQSNLHSSLNDGGVAPVAGSSMYQSLYGKRSPVSAASSAHSNERNGKENRTNKDSEGMKGASIKKFPSSKRKKDGAREDSGEPDKVQSKGADVEEVQPAQLAADPDPPTKETKPSIQTTAAESTPKDPPKGKSDRPPELASFLNSPTGMNWADLVRSMRKQREEPLLDTTIEVTDDDDVSELGSREGNRRTRDYEVDWRHDGDKKCDKGKNEEEEDELSTASSRSLCPVGKGGAASNGEEGDEIVGMTVGESTRNEEEQPKEPAATRQLSPIINSPPRSKPLPRDSLERRIERVVTGQMTGQKEAVAAPPKAEHAGLVNDDTPKMSNQSSRKRHPAKKKKKKKIPAITPPRRDRKRESSHRTKGKNSLGSIGCITPNPGSPKPLLGRAGSAFTPVQSSTPSTAVETLESPRSAFSALRLDSPGRIIGEGDEEEQSPDKRRVFSPIETEEASPQHHQQSEPLVSPQVKRAAAPQRDDPSRRVSAATKRREERLQRCGSPSDPPLLAISYSDEVDEETDGQTDALNFAAFPADPFEGAAQNCDVEGKATDPILQPEESNVALSATAAKPDNSKVIREDELEVATTATAEGKGLPILAVLPRSLSVNKKAPTCWQVARHKILPTRGEF
ncbi:hypothetical protein ACHAXT_007270 [Thalassiosira profunda]